MALVAGCCLPSAGVAQTPETPRDSATALQGGSSPFTIDDVFDLTSIRSEALSPNGQWLAVTAATTRDLLGVNNHRFGDPTYDMPTKSTLAIVNTTTGQRASVLLSATALGRENAWFHAGGMKWSPDSKRLAFAVLEGAEHRVLLYHVGSDTATTLRLPTDRPFAWSQRSLMQWSLDGRRLYLPLRPVGWRENAKLKFGRLTKGPIAVYSSEQPFLAWEALRREGNRYSVVAYDLDSGAIGDVVPAMIANGFHVPEDAAGILYLQDIAEGTDYSDFASPSAVKYQSTEGGKPRTLISSTKGLTVQWSDDHRYLAYSNKEGDVYFASIDDEKVRQVVDLTPEGGAEPKPSGQPDDSNASAQEDPFAIVRVSRDGSRLIASNKQGLWLIDTDDGAHRLFLEMPEDEPSAPIYKVVAWSNDGDHIYLSYASRVIWERGFSRYTISTDRLTSLQRSDRLYNNGIFGIELPTLLSRDNSTLVFYSSDANRPLDLYATDLDFRNVRRLTNANPQLDAKTFGGTELLSYLDADGKKLHGVLYHPVGYQPGVRYPTVFIVYETFFHNVFDETVNLLTNGGYAVVTPSVNLEVGYPGEAWIKGVTAAANLLIDKGITDGDRMGVHGISYGGYATNLLVTQTTRFKAAINISGKANMISFYTDSPRLGIRNIHAPENSQDRIGGTLWEEPHKYLTHSAVMFADRITTPLLLITGEQDHNVPVRTTLEMYYALRRLGKRVEWVNYMNGGHGWPNTNEAEMRDYYQRIIGWYDRYLKEPDEET